MSRIPVALREAVVTDAGFLAELWHDSVRRGDISEQVADLEVIIKTAADSAEQRVLVVEYGGERAGAVFLRMTTVTPLNLEPALQVLHPHVLPAFRRRGLGRALMEAALLFAEERGIAHITTGAQPMSRDGNRFLARLAMGQHAVLRMAPTHVVRAKLNAQAPSLQRAQDRRPQRVLAVRRALSSRGAAPARR
ncbi:Ribosomal protein S18 acetylase RimI [Nocardioides terrae]|uniref:Ribosomal protein S18 acetylase RimI n=1 Tax=Nocardioides terrae TaxID=574651 RepID=A0A1I1FVA7_9ACTN|nr:GNAT family N-acetyltransferase [Nocardioides terrae]SFC02972.1 Ribosomal protein S18 acetylase RimI [Nocardioides terrae]